MQKVFMYTVEVVFLVCGGALRVGPRLGPTQQT